MSLSLIFVLLLPVAIALAAVRRVPDGQAWTVRRFGRYVRTLRPGTHAVWPLLDRIARQVRLTGHHIELPTRQFGAGFFGEDIRRGASHRRQPIWMRQPVPCSS